MQKGKALGRKSKVIVFPTQSMKRDFAISMMELMKCLEVHNLNKDTFTYKVIFLEDGRSIWGMQFFKTHTVFGYAEAPKN
jgi:hypothetical protein